MTRFARHGLSHVAITSVLSRAMLVILRRGSIHTAGRLAGLTGMALLRLISVAPCLRVMPFPPSPPTQANP